MLIKFAEVYENTEVLSPIDRATWQMIAETCRVGPNSRVIELASGKGAFAVYLAKNFRCKVDCFESNPDFIHHSVHRAKEVGLSSHLRYTCSDVNSLEVEPGVYDLGVCLGALYIFREAGWRILMQGVRPKSYLVVSDLFCKKLPPPKQVVEVFFEEEGGPATLDGLRKWYRDRGVRILREEECSRESWLEYYDLTRKMLLALAKKHRSDMERRAEIEEGLREDALVRQYGEEYIGYMTFVMQKG